MRNHELERARAELEKFGADWALLSSSENVTYVSHFEVPVDFGAFAALSYSPCLALFAIRDSTSCLLVNAFCGDRAKAESALEQVLVHNVFGQFEPLSPKDNFIESLRWALQQAGLGRGKARLAIEEQSLPAVTLRLLSDEFPNVKLIEASPALTAARLVKTERELSLLRFAGEVNDAGHAELLKQCEQAGKSDYQMWGAVLTSMQMRAGRQLFVFGELVSAENCKMVSVPGGPTGYITKPGDLMWMDLSPRLNGYWSDTCNTMVVRGVEPAKKQELYGVAAREAFYAAVAMLRPGRKAHQAFEAAEATFAKYGLKIGHHAGHQIGVSVNEAPRLVPYDKTTIQEGMVFSVETGSYEGPDGTVGARMEKSVIVHENGPEVFPEFEWGF